MLKLILLVLVVLVVGTGAFAYQTYTTMSQRINTLEKKASPAKVPARDYNYERFQQQQALDKLRSDMKDQLDQQKRDLDTRQRLDMNQPLQDQRLQDPSRWLYPGR